MGVEKAGLMPALFLGNVNHLTEVTKGSLLWIDHCITYSFSENAPGAFASARGDLRAYRGHQRGEPNVPPSVADEALGNPYFHRV